MDIEYIGEQPLWGEMGHFFVVLAFVTALFSVVANALRTRSSMQNLADADGWKITCRGLYLAHAFAVIGIFLTLLLMLINHRFEYQYVWQHSKRDMPMNYILASLWEGQEGSTLLWLLWHAVIGLVLMRRAKDWEAPVLSVLSLVQVFLSMMLLGLYVGDMHIGSSPFDLIRLKEDNIGLPWTKIPDYLTNPQTPMFHDGRGLNPLLQNYWMTIHPPTLFLGFALVTVPFAFAIAGLWTKRLTDWQRPALPWAFIGVLVLGTGILMGGAWAYESLSFGGFWAWDPVENASLVPWMVLVGAAHVMLLYRQKGQSLFTTFFLCIAAFLLIVYSTFLTKSGVLSDTSVHAFTDDGLNEELTLFMGFFLWLAVTLLAFNWKLRVIYTGLAAIVLVRFLGGDHASSMLFLLLGSLVTLFVGYGKFFPKEHKEEELWSREFWMFIGSLVLVVASFQIIFYTSGNVVNSFLHVGPVSAITKWLHDTTGWEWTQKLAEGNIAPDKDSIYFYNRWQSGFAFMVVLLMAVTQYFKYKDTPMKEFRKQLFRSFAISVVISLPLVLFIYFNENFSNLPHEKQYMYWMCSFLVFGTIFSILANADYWLKILKGKVKSAGASIAHIGFGLLLLGAVISTSKKDTISRNSSRFDVSSIGGDISNEQNIFMRRGEVLPMGDYFVSYSKKTKENINGTDYVFYNVDFYENKDGVKGEKEFTLRPFIQLNPFMGNAAEPDTRHFLHKDIYTFIKYVEPSSLTDTTDYSGPAGKLFDQPRNLTVAEQDTVALSNCIAVLDSVEQAGPAEIAHDTAEIALGAHFSVFDAVGNKRKMTAYYIMNMTNGATRQVDAIDEELGVKLTFWKVRPETRKIDVYAATQMSKRSDFIVLEASIFPAINVLWLGCLIMVAGTFIAVRERIRKNKS